MSFWKKKNLPAVPPKQEVLAPEDRTITPSPPEPAGAIRSNIDGFVRRQQTKAVVAETGYVGAHADLAAEKLRAANNYEKLAKGANRLNRLDAIIADENAGIDAQLEQNAIQRQLAAERAKQELWQLQRQGERGQIHAGAQAQIGRADDRASIASAAGKAIIKETQRTILERIQQHKIAAGVHGASKEEKEAHRAAITAELELLEVLKQAAGTQADPTGEAAGLQRAIEKVKAQIEDAHEHGAPRDQLGDLYTTLRMLEKELEKL